MFCLQEFNVVRPECVNYQSIGDAWRKVNKEYSVGETNCDSSEKLFDGMSWVRLVEPAGVKLPTSPPTKSLANQLICGTHAVAWMDGLHPAVSDGIVSRQICFAYAGQECFGPEMFNVTVAACSATGDEVFYVYQLKKPGGCSFAYCAEGGKKSLLAQY